MPPLFVSCKAKAAMVSEEWQYVNLTSALLMQIQFVTAGHHVSVLSRSKKYIIASLVPVCDVHKPVAVMWMDTHSPPATPPATRDLTMAGHDGGPLWPSPLIVASFCVVFTQLARHVRDEESHTALIFFTM